MGIMENGTTMRNFFAIWRREMGGCFLSPVAYVVMVVFLALSGLVFLQLVEGHVGAREAPTTLLFKVVMFFWLPALVAVIAMRLFAEEKRSGAIELLMTAPVTECEVVLGKYAGALAFALIVTLPAISYIFLLAFFSPAMESPDTGAIFGGILILLLVLSLCVSLGLLVSLMTRNQIVAAICCFCAVLCPLLAGQIVSVLPVNAGKLAEYIAANDHVASFARGSLDTRPIVLYVSGTAFVLFAAVRLLESRRWLK